MIKKKEERTRERERERDEAGRSRKITTVVVALFHNFN
jgi:hypothetical protein